MGRPGRTLGPACRSTQKQDCLFLFNPPMYMYTYCRTRLGFLSGWAGNETAMQRNQAINRRPSHCRESNNVTDRQTDTPLVEGEVSTYTEREYP